LLITKQQNLFQIVLYEETPDIDSRYQSSNVYEITSHEGTSRFSPGKTISEEGRYTSAKSHRRSSSVLQRHSWSKRQEEWESADGVLVFAASTPEEACAWRYMLNKLVRHSTMVE